MDRLLTGLQPSGSLTIGNYSGGIKQILDYQNQKDKDGNDKYETFLFVPDMHATTVEQDPVALHKNILSAIGVYLACGVDAKKDNMHIYIQSENLYHANLSWILECITPYGQLQRMHQFKEKTKNKENFYCGLFTYPVLMAADILLYDAKYVPTGIDQKQHVELAQDLVGYFTARYGMKDENNKYFTVPESLTPTIGAKIRDLQDPSKKMSKSSPNPKSYILLLDSEKDIKKKIMGAQTDSEACIRFDEENKPGVSNLLTIYSVFSGMAIEDIVAKFDGAGYGDLKKSLAEVLIEKLSVIQDNYTKIMASGELDDILNRGRDFTTAIAKEKYEEIRKIVGYGRL